MLSRCPQPGSRPSRPHLSQTLSTAPLGGEVSASPTREDREAPRPSAGRAKTRVLPSPSMPSLHPGAPGPLCGVPSGLGHAWEDPDFAVWFPGRGCAGSAPWSAWCFLVAAHWSTLTPEHPFARGPCGHWHWPGARGPRGDIHSSPLACLPPLYAHRVLLPQEGAG